MATVLTGSNGAAGAAAATEVRRSKLESPDMFYYAIYTLLYRRYISYSIKLAVLVVIISAENSDV